MSAIGGIGAFAGGMAQGAMLGKQLKKLSIENDEKSSPFREKFSRPVDASSLLPAEKQAVERGGDLPPASSGKSFRTNDPVADDLAPYQKAFLNSLAGGESGGRYNVRYTPKGGVDFEGYDQHPGIMEAGPEGPSSAAGRYQFTKTTWDSMGGGSFAPKEQDKRAWQLAETRYKATTGRSLGDDLQSNGLTTEMLSALTPTWKALGSNQSRHIATYQESLNRYQPQPASVSSSGVGAAPRKPGALAAMERAYAADGGVPARGINPY